MTLKNTKRRIAEKLSKALNSKDYTNRLLVLSLPLMRCCKWLTKDPANRNSHTQKANKLVRTSLYKINGLSFEEKIENLSVLLFDEPGSASATDLPTNQDVLKVFKSIVEQNIPSLPVYDIVINQICAVAWQRETSNYFWCLGYVKDIQEDCVIVDHLCPANQNLSKHWKYPSRHTISFLQPSPWCSCGRRLEEFIGFKVANVHFTQWKKHNINIRHVLCRQLILDIYQIDHIWFIVFHFISFVESYSILYKLLLYTITPFKVPFKMGSSRWLVWLYVYSVSSLMEGSNILIIWYCVCVCVHACVCWLVCVSMFKREGATWRKMHQYVVSPLPIQPYPTALLNGPMNSGLSVYSMLFLRIDSFFTCWSTVVLCYFSIFVKY